MISGYLMFKGNCEEALRTYADAFNAQVIEVSTYGDMPSTPEFQIPDDERDMILHAKILIEGAELMCADSAEGRSSGSNMFVTITNEDEEFIKRAWNILKQDAEIYMDLAPTFFAKLHGSLKDRFDINWMFTASNTGPV